jgi:hypothetical protein
LQGLRPPPYLPFFCLILLLATAAASTERERLQQRAALAADYLIRAIEPDGRFVYRRDAVSGQIDRRRYNLLRHAGTLYALVDHYSEFPPGDKQRAALARAAGFLRDCCIAPVAGEPELLALWSWPELTGDTRPLRAKLGGAGLALLALARLEALLPDATPPATLRGLGEFIRFMQRPDGGFHSLYIPERGGRQDDWISLYYPGEAALGLLALYRMDDDPRWRSAALDALRYLARERAGRERVPADHWALLATAELLRPDARPLPEADREWLIGHAMQIVDGILAEQQLDLVAPAVRGGFGPDGRTTPTATRLEGLLAALEFLPDDAYRGRLRQAVRAGIGLLLAAQLTEGEFAGALPRGGSGRRAGELRIDYTQHALSALLVYRRLFHPSID